MSEGGEALPCPGVEPRFRMSRSASARQIVPTALAQVTGNMDRYRVRVADHRLFVPSGSVADGRLKQWPGDLALTATTIDDFR